MHCDLPGISLPRLLRWETAQALDLLCADESAPAEDLETMIAAARTAGVAESKIQAATAEAAQRREGHANAPRTQTIKSTHKARCC